LARNLSAVLVEQIRQRDPETAQKPHCTIEAIDAGLMQP
jgi:hypothetical protein